ncbi:MAG: hypothetical protein RBT15_07200 [Gudongella sp.]|nr:hypothetical protein [Gudongella sp.]
MPFFMESSALRIIMIMAIFLVMISDIFIIISKWSRKKELKVILRESLLFIALFANLSVLMLVHYNLEYEIANVTSERLLSNRYFFVQIIIISVSVVWQLFEIYSENRIYKTSITHGSIKEAIDRLPRGLCISQIDGMPVLINSKMIDICLILTGKNFINANLFWDDIVEFSDIKGAVKMKEFDDPTFVLDDRSVWKVTRENHFWNEVRYIETIATDITEMYWLSRGLKISTQKLEDYQLRLKNLLKNIERVKHEEEILESKVRLHDELGRTIIATRRHILNSDYIEDSSLITHMWESVTNALSTDYMYDDSSESMGELLRISEVLGCNIVFQGDHLDSEGHYPILESAVREAMINAVKHGNANELTVDIGKGTDVIKAIISDNGKSNITEIEEGVGLSTLRGKVETAGGFFSVFYEEGVKMYLEVPVEEESYV